ncbi:MAG: DNA primase [Bdellovibrionales bacterium]|nr:DNA primase [Bdellovibrionales bacterium]
MRFPPDFVDKVRQANNIVDVIGPYTQLRSTGSNFMGRCPFPDHNDKTASFSVSEDKQLYNCFGCKKSGNVFTFLQTFNGYSFPEAIEHLARRANIPLPERDEDPREKRQREMRENVLKANRLSASYFFESFKRLPENSPIRAYADKRGLSPEIIETFQIGYSPDEWHGLTKVLKSRRIPAEVGEQAGLIRKSNRSGGANHETHFDLFRGRLMFPIVSTSGDVLAFGGRILGEGEPKYLNSPETPVFHKGRVLYGLDVTARYIRSQDEAIIVEGYMDAVALYGAGLKNVAAILGTAFTPEHGKLLRRMTPNVVMLLDGDRAGIQGAERSLPALLAADIRPRGVILPEGMDPDDFIRAKGVESLQDEMARAGDLFTLLLTRHWMAGYRATAQDKLSVVEQIAAALAPAGISLLEQAMAELFIEETAKYLDVDSAWVRKTLTAKMHSGVARGAGPGPKAVERVADRAPESARGIRGDGIAVGDATGDTTGHAASGPTLEDSRVDLEGISREELAALGLLLQSKTLMEDLSEASKEWLQAGGAREDHPIAFLLDHDGGRKLAAMALRRYGQQPDGFATVAASLLGNLTQPGLLTKSMAEVMSGSVSGSPLGASAEGDRRYMARILNAIQRRRKQADLNRISLQLRENATPERSQMLMEKFVIIQREIREIENERRSFDRE